MAGFAIDTGSSGAGRQGGEGHREAAADRVDGGTDAFKHFGQLVRREPGETSGRGQEVEPRLAGVGRLSVEAPLLRLGEGRHSLDRFGKLGEHRMVEVQGMSGALAGEGRVGHHASEDGSEGLGHLDGGARTWPNTVGRSTTGARARRRQDLVRARVEPARLCRADSVRAAG